MYWQIQPLTYWEYVVVDVQGDVKDVEREPGEGEGDDDGHEERVGPSLTLDLLLETGVLHRQQIGLRIWVKERNVLKILKSFFFLKKRYQIIKCPIFKYYLLTKIKIGLFCTVFKMMPEGANFKDQVQKTSSI